MEKAARNFPNYEYIVFHLDCVVCAGDPGYKPQIKSVTGLPTLTWCNFLRRATFYFCRETKTGEKRRRGLGRFEFFIRTGYLYIYAIGWKGMLNYSLKGNLARDIRNAFRSECYARESFLNRRPYVVASATSPGAGKMHVS